MAPDSTRNLVQATCTKGHKLKKEELIIHDQKDVDLD